GLVGLVDDVVKTFGKDKREGLTPRQKLAAQIGIGLAVGALLCTFYDGFSVFGFEKGFALTMAKAETGGASPMSDTAPATIGQCALRAPPIEITSDDHKKVALEPKPLAALYPPGTRTFFPLGSVFFVLFCALVLTGSSNAVNLTDGLDGL